MITIENIDCLVGLKELEDESVDLVITSPPYNLGKTETTINMCDYIGQQVKIINELQRILKKTGSICYQVGTIVKDQQITPLDILLDGFFKQFDFQLRNRIIWHFGSGWHNKFRFSGRYETIMWYTKTDDYKFNLDDVRVPQKYPNKKAYQGKNIGKLSCNPLGKNPGDVWEICNVKGKHPEKTSHPCQFPLDLVNRLVLAFSDEGDLVVDPFMGSGTTALSCLMNNRSCIGFEIQKEYVEMSNQRLEQWTQQNGS